MRAVVLREYGGPEKLKFEDNVPEPQMSGSSVLIAAAAASVNPIDWKLRSGMMQKNYPLSFPAILGRDVSGIVRKVGANVQHFKAGDCVLALSNKTYAELVAEAIENFRLVDAIADTVGGEVAAKLIARVKQGGSFGYTTMLPESAAAKNPTVKITRVGARPDASKVREFADDVRDGKFVLPIGRRMPLRDAAEAHVLGQKGGIGKILLLAPDPKE
jgi:NADPH:quinone reductase-like Zn-dependent oxidoreductase